MFPPRIAVLLLLVGCQAIPPSIAGPEEAPSLSAPAGSAPPLVVGLPSLDHDRELPELVRGEGCKARLPASHPLTEVDWCSADLQDGFVTLEDGYGEMREYEEIGVPHDTCLFRLVEVLGSRPGARPAWAVAHVWEENSYANGGSHEGSRLYLFEAGRSKPSLLRVYEVSHGQRMKLEAWGEGFILWSRSDAQFCRTAWWPGAEELPKLCRSLP
jgi:hypothetical protein